MRFSGHDTFHCREQWLLKGFQIIEKEGSTSKFNSVDSIVSLGVGKNMVRSVLHWIKAFNIWDDDLNDRGELSKILFDKLEVDPFLENEGSLWLLQYYLCTTKYASIFHLLFLDYFSDKATFEFSESQVRNFVKRRLREANLKPITDKTFSSDFKVLIKTYVTPDKDLKTVEDDFNAPLLTLNLISDTGKRNSLNEHIYRLNKSKHESLSIEIFGYCLLSEFEGSNSIGYDEIRKKLGSYLCLSNEFLEKLVEQLCLTYDSFIYKDDAGIRQIQVRNNFKDLRISLLTKHYGVEG